MFLSRRLAPKVTAISLLVTLCILAVISIGLGATCTVFHQGWLKRTGKIFRRDAADILLDINVEEFGEVIEDSSDSVVTVTVCTPVDSLPTIGVLSAASLPTSPQNLTGQQNGDLASAASIIITSSLAASAFSNSPSTLPASSLLSSTAEHICLCCTTTVYLTNCSAYEKTSTVTNTYSSTVSECSVTRYSFIAASTVTVTANISANVPASTTNSSLNIVPIRTIVASQGFPPFPVRNLSSSAIFCPNGIQVQHQQDCQPSQSTTTLNFSSFASPALASFEPATISIGSSVPQQTSRGNISSSVVPTGRSISLGHANVSFNLNTTRSNGTDVSSLGGFPLSSSQSGPASNIQLGSLSSITYSVVSNIITATTLFPPMESSSKGLLSGTSSGSPIVTSGQGAIPSVLSNDNSPGSSVPFTTSILNIKSDVVNSTTPVISPGLSVILPFQNLLSSALGDTTAASGSIFPLATSVPALVSSILSGINPVLVSVSLPVGFAQTPVRNVTTAAVPAASSFQATRNSLPTNISHIAASALTPVLSAPVAVSGGVNIVVSILEPISSILPTIVNAVQNVTKGLGNRLRREAANNSLMSTITIESPSAVTVTKVVSIVTVFVQRPPNTTST